MILHRAAANILNNQSRTADKGWFSGLGTRRGANKSSVLRNVGRALVNMVMNFWGSLKGG
jgi:hypothetical protein